MGARSSDRVPASLGSASAIAKASPHSSTYTTSSRTTSAMLDPACSERQIYRAPHNGQQREIWRPGDGDGSVSTDYFERQGDPLPLHLRWRLFQSDIGPIRAEKNEPPKYVVLDDRAAWEVYHSNIARSHLTNFWPHDFGGSGKLRARRPHRGRGALKDVSADGDAKFHSAPTGKSNTYFFKGEKDYMPVLYHVPSKPAPKRKAPSPEPYNPRAHGHNQFTPKDQLVKHGAPSFGKPPEQRRARIKSLLSTSASPSGQKAAHIRHDRLRPMLSSAGPAFAKIAHELPKPQTPKEGERDTKTPHDACSISTASDSRGNGSMTAERPTLSLRQQMSSNFEISPRPEVQQMETDARLKKLLNDARLTHQLQSQEIEDLKCALQESQAEAKRWKLRCEGLQSRR